MNDSTTITVSVELRNEHEVLQHAQYLAIILAGRANSGAGFVTTTPQPPAPAVEEPAPSSPWSPPVQPESAEVVADISPSSVERQFRTYAAAKGAAVARALLDRYSAQYLRDVPADKLAAFVSEMGS